MSIEILMLTSHVKALEVSLHSVQPHKVRKPGYLVSHSEQLHFFRQIIELFPNHFSGKVLDIGSLDINGGPHRLISPLQYVGVDIAPGENVFLVSKGEDVSLPSGSFDVAMSSECFEHNPNWRATFHNMIRMTRPGGLIVWTCATIGRAEHGTSRSDGGYSAPLNVQNRVEYYHNVSEQEVLVCIDDSLFDYFGTLKNDQSKDLYFIGLKKGAPLDSITAVRDFLRKYEDYLSQ